MAKPDNKNDQDDILVTLDMDDGSQVECEILTIFEVKGQDYIALLPLDEEGNPDYECLGAVDVSQFNEDMRRLMLGDAVEIPVFNFKKGKREYEKCGKNRNRRVE